MQLSTPYSEVFGVNVACEIIGADVGQRNSVHKEKRTIGLPTILCM